MKIYRYIVGLMSIVSLTACSDWLDLQPTDTTEEEQLFETGDGYRNALNGIYRQMASSTMYGKELTWGAVEAMAQNYYPHVGTVEEYFMDFKYNQRTAQDVISGVWTTAYNNIANCNNLIQRAAKAPVSLFKKGEDERNLIHGEALALRAVLHFDILRLFAPGPALDDGKKYVPYVDSYPITFKEYISNKDFLDRIIGDLKEAKRLVGEFDMPRSKWMRTISRFEGDHQGIDDAPDELFFAYRGYRMNYYAICGMLARVYLYAGMYKEAFDETEIVLNATFDDYGSKMFAFASGSDGDTKLYSEILFSLSNQKLVDNYTDYTSNYSLAFSFEAGDWFDGDPNDRRSTWLIEDDFDYLSAKYSQAEGSSYRHAQDMLPMIRMGEMYLIRAECYLKKLGTKEQALEQFAILRRGHGCSSENVKADGDDWFNEAVIAEARREFLQEGQLYFYYKRLNIKPTYSFKPEYFRWPYPENEVL